MTPSATTAGGGGVAHRQWRAHHGSRDPRGFRNHRQDLEAAESGGAAHRDTAVEEADLNSDPSIRSGWRELGHLSRWERSGFSRSSEEIRVSGHGETIVCNPHPNLEQDA